jgi:adenylylsulfate kinase-like enzyme
METETRPRGAQAVLITGVYGTGKTSVVEEMADVLEGRGVRYAALDLDWLAWFNPGSPSHAAGFPVMLENVGAVIGNYLEAGVTHIAMAGSMSSADQVQALRDTLGMRLMVVRLTLPIEEIERRIGDSPTAGRQDDLEVARTWIAEGRGETIGDLVIENDRPLREVAQHVLDALGW